MWRHTSRRKQLYGEVGGGEGGREEVLLRFLVSKTYLNEGNVLLRDYADGRVGERCQRIQHPVICEVKWEQNEGGVLR